MTQSQIKKEQVREDRKDERASKKAFNYLVRMAKKKGALVDVSYNAKP